MRGGACVTLEINACKTPSVLIDLGSTGNGTLENGYVHSLEFEFVFGHVSTREILRYLDPVHDTLHTFGTTQ